MTLGNIDPLLAAALKACLIPARVLMCFARHVAELNLKCCFVRVYVHREVGFQEVLVLFPVDRRLKVDARARGVEVNFLADDRTADLALNLESCAHGAAFRPFHALHDAQTGKLITNALYTFIEIPHSCNSFSIAVWGFVKTGAFDLILA